MALEGKLVCLREERETDLPLLVRLRNDLETQAWSKSLAPDFTEAMYRQRYESRGFSFDHTDGRFIIERLADGEAIGYCGFYDLQSRLSVTWGIAVRKDCWGAGFALDAQETILKFFFEEYGLRVVRMYTHSGNQGMVRLGEKSGFRISVRLREAVFKGGRFYDTLLMDLLREEYYERHPELEDHLPPLG